MSRESFESTVNDVKSLNIPNLTCHKERIPYPRRNSSRDYPTLLSSPYYWDSPVGRLSWDYLFLFCLHDRSTGCGNLIPATEPPKTRRNEILPFPSYKVIPGMDSRPGQRKENYSCRFMLYVLPTYVSVHSGSSIYEKRVLFRVTFPSFRRASVRHCLNTSGQ